jgi:hypothetical protein
LGGQDWVNRYDLVYPKISSQSQNVDRTAYPDELTVELTVEGQKLTMELQLNKLVFGKNFKHTVHEKSGIKEFTNAENCYYQGKVKERPGWTAVISSCKGLKGAFGILASRNDSYYIEPMEGKTGGLHIIYRPSELSDEHFIGACGTPTDNKDSFFPDIPSFASHGMKEFKGLKVKRQASTQLYLELYVVTDVQSYSLRNGNLQSLLQDVVEAVNTMDSFYQTLNTVVRVALVEIETWTATNQIPITADSSATLTQWKAYYQRNIKTKDANPDAGILFV